MRYRTVYYREENGDFMQVGYARTIKGAQRNYIPEGILYGRAAAIEHDPSSVCTTQPSREYIKTRCKPIRKADVPKRWLSFMNP